MKGIFLSVLALLSASLQAQQKEGRVVYQRTAQVQIRLDNDNPMAQQMPRQITEKYELIFGANQSLWKKLEEEPDNSGGDINGGGMQIHMIIAGSDDMTFTDFSNSKKIEQRELFDKKFLIEDSIRPLNWKLSDQTRTLLGHVCHKATADRIGKRMQMNMDNGVMKREEHADTSHLTAWFTTDIPVAGGPEVQGQLPGLILALDINGGRMVYVAVDLQPKADMALLKAPTKGKKVSPEEFNRERDKMMSEMQKNGPPGARREFHMNN